MALQIFITKIYCVVTLALYFLNPRFPSVMNFTALLLETVFLGVVLRALLVIILPHLQK